MWQAGKGGGREGWRRVRPWGRPVPVGPTNASTRQRAQHRPAKPPECASQGGSPRERGRAGPGRNRPCFSLILRPELQQHQRSLCPGTKTGTSHGLVPSACISAECYLTVFSPFPGCAEASVHTEAPASLRLAMSRPTLKEWMMEGPLEDGDESPDSQDPATDWRFAVCRFRDACDEEEPAPQMQVKDPNPPRPPAGAAQGKGLQGSPLPGEFQSTPGQMAVDGSEDGQRGTLGGSSGKSEEPFPSEVESLLYPVSSHLSLAQGKSASQGGGLGGNPNPGRVMTTGLDPGGLDSDSVDLGATLSDTSSQLLEAGKGAGQRCLGREWECLERDAKTWGGL